METSNVLTDKWEFKETPNDMDFIGDIKNVCAVYIGKEKEAQLIVSAVNACKAINPSNPLKVAIGMERLFKVLDEVITDKRLHPSLYVELSSIVDTIKSDF